MQVKRKSRLARNPELLSSGKKRRGRGDTLGKSVKKNGGGSRALRLAKEHLWRTAKTNRGKRKNMIAPKVETKSVSKVPDLAARRSTTRCFAVGGYTGKGERPQIVARERGRVLPAQTQEGGGSPRKHDPNGKGTSGPVGDGPKNTSTRRPRPTVGVFSVGPKIGQFVRTQRKAPNKRIGDGRGKPKETWGTVSPPEKPGDAMWWVKKAMTTGKKPGEPST